MCFGRSKKRRIFLRRCYWVFAKEAHEDCVGHSSKLPGEAVIELSVQHYTNKASDVVQSLPGEPLWQIQVKHDARPSVTSLVHPAISWVLESWVGPAAQYISYILCSIYTSIYTIFMCIYQNFMCIFICLCVSKYLYLRCIKIFPSQSNWDPHCVSLFSGMQCRSG